MLLYNIHTYYGHFLQLVPVLVIGWVLWRRGTPLQRVAPILLDINVALGLLLYLVNRVPVSIWHPVLMFAAIGVAHAVARNQNRNVVIGAWVLVLVLVALGIRVAAGGPNT